MAEKNITNHHTSITICWCKAFVLQNVVLNIMTRHLHVEFVCCRNLLVCSDETFCHSAMFFWREEAFSKQARLTQSASNCTVMNVNILTS